MLSLREAAKRYGVVMRVLMQPRQAFAGRKHNQLQRSVLCATEEALHVRLSLAGATQRQLKGYGCRVEAEGRCSGLKASRKVEKKEMPSNKPITQSPNVLNLESLP